MHAQFKMRKVKWVPFLCYQIQYLCSDEVSHQAKRIHPLLLPTYFSKYGPGKILCYFVSFKASFIKPVNQNSQMFQNILEKYTANFF